MAKTNKFTSMSTYVDTRGAGGITIQGIELENDADGNVEAPAAFQAEMETHGYLMEGSKAYNEWKAAQLAEAVAATGKKKR